MVCACVWVFVCLCLCACMLETGEIYPLKRMFCHDRFTVCCSPYCGEQYAFKDFSTYLSVWVWVYVCVCVHICDCVCVCVWERRCGRSLFWQVISVSSPDISTHMSAHTHCTHKLSPGGSCHVSRAKTYCIYTQYNRTENLKDACHTVS